MSINGLLTGINVFSLNKELAFLRYSSVMFMNIFSNFL